MIRKALAGFRGVGRRFSKLGEWNGAAIIDDYAHNPFKIAAALKADVKDGRYDWWVERFVYPYTRGTMAAPTPKIDDGHNH